jgi:hypothetical protein
MKKLIEANKNSIQKFTDADSVEGILRSVYKLTPEHISLLSQDKKDELAYVIKHKLRYLHGDEYDAFYFKIQGIMTDKFKNVTFDRNHAKIKLVIKEYVMQYRRMPTVTEIADICQMSRVTVSKHLKDFDLFDYDKEQTQMLKMMFSDLMGQIFEKAIAGDFASTKLFADIMMRSSDNTGTIFKAKNQQNNIIVGPQQ